MKFQTMKLSPAWVLLTGFFMTPAALAAQPAWCSKGNLQETETIICNDATLSQADALLEQMYRAVLGFRGLEGHEGVWPGEIVADQREWVSERDRLREKADILDAYSERIKSLTQMLKLRWQPKK